MLVLNVGDVGVVHQLFNSELRLVTDEASSISEIHRTPRGFSSYDIYSLVQSLTIIETPPHSPKRSHSWKSIEDNTREQSCYTRTFRRKTQKWSLRNGTKMATRRMVSPENSYLGRILEMASRTFFKLEGKECRLARWHKEINKIGAMYSQRIARGLNSTGWHLRHS